MSYNLEIFLLKYSNHGVCSFLKKALKHHCHVKKLSLLPLKAGRSRLILQLLFEVDRASKWIKIYGQLNLFYFSILSCARTFFDRFV